MGTAIVIGADRGIGAALVELYHGRGDDAVAVCLEDGIAWAERGSPETLACPDFDGGRGVNETEG